MDIKPNLNQLNKLIQPSNLAKPFHIQQIEKALNVSGFLKQVYSFIDDQSLVESNDTQIVPLKKHQSQSIRNNSKSVKSTVAGNHTNKQWLPSNVILDKSDSESSDPDAGFVSNDEIEQLIKMQQSKQQKINEKTSANESQSLNVPKTKSDEENINSVNNQTTLNCSAVNCEIYLTPAKMLDESMFTSCQSFEQPDISSLAPIQQISDLENTALLPTIEVKSERLPLADTSQLNFQTTAPLLPKLKQKPTQPDMLDHITYDPTLPDEILQGESNTGDNFISSFPSSTLTTSTVGTRTDQIVYSQQLPDDIFDAEQDTNALSPPQIQTHDVPINTNQITLDSICKVINNSNENKSVNVNQKNFTSIKTINNHNSNGNTHLAVKASNLLNPASPQLKKITKKKESRSGSLRPEKSSIEMLNAKRRKVWISIARKDIPKAQKQKVNQKREMLVSCKRVASMCTRERASFVGAGTTIRSSHKLKKGQSSDTNQPSNRSLSNLTVYSNGLCSSNNSPVDMLLTKDGISLDSEAHEPQSYCDSDLFMTTQTTNINCESAAHSESSS